MPEPTSLINLGELSKPVTVLIEKISDAFGGAFRPFQTRRVARADADAAIIEAKAKIEVTELEQRAIRRFVVEEGKKQQNIEDIIRKAIPDVTEDSNPENIDSDWLTNYFDKCRLISDCEMQVLWAKILAGEANKAGSFSKRTISAISSIDKDEARIFSSLSHFVWNTGYAVPIVFDPESSVMEKKGLNFGQLMRLDSIGLIIFNGTKEFRQKVHQDTISISYHGENFLVRIHEDADKSIPLGEVVFSPAGLELSAICHTVADQDCKEHVLARWRDVGFEIEVGG